MGTEQDGRAPRNDGGVGADDRWLDELDEELDELPAEYSMRVCLPVGADCWVDGVPYYRVDRYAIVAAGTDAVLEALLTMDGAVLDPGEPTPRVLLFDPGRPQDAGDPLSFLAVVWLKERRMRLETAKPTVRERIRARVQAALGARVRYLGWHDEDAFAGDGADW